MLTNKSITKLRQIIREEVLLLQEGVQEEQDMIDVANEIYDLCIFHLVKNTRYIIWRSGTPHIPFYRFLSHIEVPNSIVWMIPAIRNTQLIVQDLNRSLPGRYSPAKGSIYLNIIEHESFLSEGLTFQQWLETQRGRDITKYAFNEFRSDFVHEFRHVYQIYRGNPEKMVAGLVKGKDDYVAYVNHPMEVDARIVQAIGSLRRIIEKGNMPPHSIQKFIQYNVEDSVWDAFTEKNRRKLMSRVGRYWTEKMEPYIRTWERDEDLLADMNAQKLVQLASGDNEFNRISAEELPEVFAEEGIITLDQLRSLSDKGKARLINYFRVARGQSSAVGI